jgi:NlpC/P60 family
MNFKSMQTLFLSASFAGAIFSSMSCLALNPAVAETNLASDKQAVSLISPEDQPASTRLQNLPHLSSLTKSNRIQKAVAFAKARIGHTDWNNQCELFVERAYGTSGRFYSAKDNYVWQKAAGRLHTQGTPPPGAFVFFKSTTRWQHVALSIGGGKAISTGPKVYIMTISSRGDYLGWSVAPSSWPGL